MDPAQVCDRGVDYRHNDHRSSNANQKWCQMASHFRCATRILFPLLHRDFGRDQFMSRDAEPTAQRTVGRPPGYVS